MDGDISRRRLDDDIGASKTKSPSILPPRARQSIQGSFFLEFSFKAAVKKITTEQFREKKRSQTFVAASRALIRAGSLRTSGGNQLNDK